MCYICHARGWLTLPGLLAWKWHKSEERGPIQKSHSFSLQFKKKNWMGTKSLLQKWSQNHYFCLCSSVNCVIFVTRWRRECSWKMYEAPNTNVTKKEKQRKTQKRKSLCVIVHVAEKRPCFSLCHRFPRIRCYPFSTICNIYTQVQRGWQADYRMLLGQW